MPLYEYECQACHRRTEKIQKFSDPELTVCPFCNGPLERTLTAPAVHFAGGGWYKDGYGSARPASGEGKSEGKGEAKSEGSSGSSDAPASSSGSGEGSSAAAPASSTPAPSAAPAPSKSSS